MPYRYYHGRTGKIFHVVNRAVGILINKRVRHRIMVKRVYVRFEHIQPSKCRENFIARVKSNNALALEAKKKGTKVSLKRKPRDPPSWSRWEENPSKTWLSALLWRLCTKVCTGTSRIRLDTRRIFFRPEHNFFS